MPAEHIVVLALVGFHREPEPLTLLKAAAVRAYGLTT
jgi:hypothetical protein